MFKFSLISIETINLVIQLPTRLGNLKYRWPFAQKQFVELQPEIDSGVIAIQEHFERPEHTSLRKVSKKLSKLEKKLVRFRVQIPINEFCEPLHKDNNENLLRWGLHLIDIQTCIRNGMNLASIQKSKIGELPDSADKVGLCILFGYRNAEVQEYF